MVTRPRSVISAQAYITGQDPYFPLYFEELKEMEFQGMVL